ncbi:hypothetical protein T11_8057, partial [Trichinella zimbabwensis]
MSAVQFTLSQRGKRKVVFEGYSYVFDRATDAKELWRCEERGRCKARLHTVGDSVVRKVGSHCHELSAARAEAAVVVTRVKRRAQETMEMTAQVINQCTTSLSQAAQGALLTLRALKQMLRRRRNKLGTPLAAPTSLETLIIPEEFTTYAPHHGELVSFLLADSGPSPQRILIFGSQRKLAILRESRTWYVDGTFQSAPPLFCQIYVILAEALGGVHPVLYALLPDKSRSTYDRLFDMVKEIVPEANPRSISCDFEMAAFNAIRTAFPAVRLHGCLFHLAQNMRRHLCTLDLFTRYKNDADFALQAKMVVALTFVPTEGIEQAIDSLAGHLPDELQPLLDWFEDSYVGRRNRRGGGRRPPMFPMEMWSMYRRVVDGDCRTNNFTEAAHRRLKAELGMAHPTIWKLIDSLRK